MSAPTPSMKTDFIDPKTEDWRGMDDAALYWAVKDGIPQAVAEAKRRDAAKLPPSQAEPNPGE